MTITLIFRIVIVAGCCFAVLIVSLYDFTFSHTILLNYWLPLAALDLSALGYSTSLFSHSYQGSSAYQTRTTASFVGLLHMLWGSSHENRPYVSHQAQHDFFLLKMSLAGDDVRCTAFCCVGSAVLACARPLAPRKLSLVCHNW